MLTPGVTIVIRLGSQMYFLLNLFSRRRVQNERNVEGGDGE